LGYREFEIRTPEMKSGADCFSTGTKGAQNLPAVLPAVGLSCNRRQDLRGALRAIHERLAVVELEAKLSGQIVTSQRNVTINVQAISPEEAVEYARDILEMYSDVPPRELPTPLIEAESDAAGTEGYDAN
jgi:hypothetical protein